MWEKKIQIVIKRKEERPFFKSKHSGMVKHSPEINVADVKLFNGKLFCVILLSVKVCISESVGGKLEKGVLWWRENCREAV